MPAWLLSPVVLKIAAGLLIAGALAYGWHRMKDGYREEGRAEVRAAWEADKAQRIERTTAMTLLWDIKRQEAETAIQERDHERAARQADARKRAASLPPAVAGAHFPAAAVSVLNRAIGDTAPAAGPAAQPDAAAPAAAESANSTVGQLTEWGVIVVGMYETCRARVTEWAAFYAALQAAQPKEAP